MTTDREFSYFEFEECIAHFKANPPVGRRVELDFTEEEIQHIRDQAAHYGCTIDSFLAAVVTCFMTELKRRERCGAEI